MTLDATRVSTREAGQLLDKLVSSHLPRFPRPGATSSCDDDPESKQAIPDAGLSRTKRRSSLKTRHFSFPANADRERRGRRRPNAFAYARRRYSHMPTRSASPVRSACEAATVQNMRSYAGRDQRLFPFRPSWSDYLDGDWKSKCRPLDRATSRQLNKKERMRQRRRPLSKPADCKTHRQSATQSAEGKKARLHFGQWQAGSTNGIVPS
jgi:hypothetical protein